MQTNNKLRDALKSCVDEMCDRCRELAAARGNPLPCLSGCEPVRKAKFALAKPPRNCDKYDTPEKAFEAHLRYCRAHPGCRGCKWWESPCCDFYWLYAAANESEVSE